MLLWKYYEYVSKKVFKIAMCKKQPVRGKKKTLHSDSLSFFQSSFSEFCVKILDKHL